MLTVPSRCHSSALPARAPFEVMAPDRLAAMQPSRLSASRSLIARMRREAWTVHRTRFGIDARGDGTAVYEVRTAERTFSLLVFSNEPVLQDRSPRIIGRSWDMAGALIEGRADEDRLRQTREELPKLYAGRAAPGTLVWCRSNRSLTVFEHVVARLAEGRQPDLAELRETGYLMRNTGLDANGTFGTRSFLSYGPRHPLAVPYHAQMLTAYLMREFAADLCDHLAALKAPGRATALDPGLRRWLGLGNGSGLGLVLFVGQHPRVVHRWIAAREEALAAARSLPLLPGDPRFGRLRGLLDRVIAYRQQDPVEYRAVASSKQVAAELVRARQQLDIIARTGTADGHTGLPPLEAFRVALRDRASLETQEVVNALLVELVPDVADRLTGELTADEHIAGDPTMTTGDLRALIEDRYAWLHGMPHAPEEQRDRFWYKSRSAEEPRCGSTTRNPGGFDLAVDHPGSVRSLRESLEGCHPKTPVGEFLYAHPGLRATTETLQALKDEQFAIPYADILDRDFVPVHLIRLVNSALYGLDRTKDFLNRNVRGLIFQGAPTARELHDPEHTDWAHPPEPS